MKPAKFITTTILGCLCSILLSQDSSVPLLPDTLKESIAIYIDGIGDIGSSKVLSSDFNQGLISDPLLLLQGQVAGLQIYNRGGDPNTQSIARIRGISSLDSDIQPLVVIDGIPSASIENIDPNDIESIEVLKDGFSRARYGARGANGVILIRSKGHKLDSLFSVQYHGNIGSSTATKDITLLSRSEFLSNNGNDFGSETDFLSEIKRSGTSQAHGIAVSKGFENYNFRVSGNYRNTQGVLVKSGFQQYNGGAKLAFNLFDDRLNIDLDGKMTQKSQNFSFREAFRYALTANPTYPIFAKDAPFNFSEETFGGYYESLGLFAAYNPVALLELNERTNDISTSIYRANISYEVFKGLHVATTYSNHTYSTDFGEFGGKTSYFLGTSLGGDRAGFGVVDSYTSNTVYSDSYVNFEGKMDDFNISIRGGYSFQEFKNTSSSLSYEWPNLSDVFETDSSNNSSKLISFYNQIEVNRNEKLFLDLGLRYEGSSLLPEESNWQFYPSIRLGCDLGSITNLENDHLFLSGSYGVSGSKNDIYPPDPWMPTPVLVEKNRALDFSIDYNRERFKSKLSFYSAKTDNVNFSHLTFGENPYANITTRGAELELFLTILKKRNVRYDSKLLISSYKSIIDEVSFFDRSYASPGSPGFGSAALLRIAEGEAFGLIYAPVFKGIDADGFTIYEDVNNDGMVNVSSSQDLDSDYANVGNANPNFELGWQHKLSILNYDISFLFRGAFGHSLINLNRMFYENNPLVNDVYNSVNTSKSVEGLNEARYSSLYVEDASFIKLDNLSLSRTFKIGSANRTIQLSLIGQNLLTITGYTGSDPEPSFYDLDGSGYFAPGIDRRASYRPSRTVSVGVKFNLN